MLNSFWDWVTGTNRQGPQATPSIYPYDYSQLYQRLYDLYNNDDTIATNDTTRRLRTVVNRSVEFYASKMLPGAEIKVDSKSPNVKKAVEQVITDSNFANNKPAMLRGFSLYGDSFLRVRAEDSKVHIEDVSPFYVTDFADDSIGTLSYIRIDIPVLNENGIQELYTEYWDAEAELYRSWRDNAHSSTTLIKDMPTPVETKTFAQLGISFIPIVHTKFRDNGDQRGLGCTYHALDKIYEANRIATRLHDLLFRFGKPAFVASANDKDVAGRPLPPPTIDTTSTGTASEKASEGPLGDWYYLPGMSKLEALIPPINYNGLLDILNAQMEEIEKDLPELRWYALSPTSQSAMSGTALRTLLGAAIDRANEARNNFLASLVRAFKMALTIGKLAPEAYGSPAIDFELQVDDSWGQSTDEKAATMQSLTQAGVPPKSAMKLAGFSDEQVDEAFPKAVEPAPGAPGAPNPSPAANSTGRNQRFVPNPKNTPVRVN